MNLIGSAGDYLPLALAAAIGGCFAVIAAMINRPKVKEAKKAAEGAHTAAAEAAEKAQGAKEAAEKGPSDETMRSLFEVIVEYQDELRAERQEKSELHSKLRQLWRLLAEDYPELLEVSGLEEPPWPES